MTSTTGPLSWRGQELTVYPPRWPLRAVWGTGDQLTLSSVEFNTSTDTSSGGAKGTRKGNRTHICLSLNFPNWCKRVKSHKFTHTQPFPEATKPREGEKNGRMAHWLFPGKAHMLTQSYPQRNEGRRNVLSGMQTHLGWKRWQKLLIKTIVIIIIILLLSS